MKILKQIKPVLYPVIILAGIIGYVAYRTRLVPTPRRRWRRFEDPAAIPLNASACASLQGIYVVEDGKSFLGRSAVVKSSYTVEEDRTVYHLSIFCEKAGTYLLCEGKMQGDALLLSGHWRRAAANGTGVVQLVMETGAAALQQPRGNKTIVIKGHYGNGNQKPHKIISLRYQEPLPAVPRFDIIAHRGGSRNVDFLGVSENSIEMIKMATRLGANGIEIDVRMTKDGVPVVFHDSFFSIHTIRDKIYSGLLHNHTLEEVRRYELRKGGKIPTLEEMLSVVLHQTPLEVIWLDIKKECDLEQISRMQKKFHDEAAAIQRNFIIYIGIPDNYLLNCFKMLANYREIPSLTELDWNVAVDINAQVWAPQYTGGFQADDEDKVHTAGKKAYVWSLDNRWLIKQYVSKGNFDGLVTNVPPVVMHWYYTKGYKMKRKQLATREQLQANCRC